MYLVVLPLCLFRLVLCGFICSCCFVCLCLCGGLLISSFVCWFVCLLVGAIFSFALLGSFECFFGWPVVR